MRRIRRLLLWIAVSGAMVTAMAGGVLGLAAPAANAVTANLAALWTTVLETPDAQNPFGSGGAAFACLNLGGTVAPFGPSGVESCTVKPGTKIFVAVSAECSTFEGNGTTEAQLRTCARQSDLQVAPSVTVDGASVPVTEAETPLLHIVLPANNIFGQPAGTTGLSVGHGWVALLQPLTPGTHAIVIVSHRAGFPDTTITTKIIVKPGH
jgi:hypothetical protein